MLKRQQQQQRLQLREQLVSHRVRCQLWAELCNVALIKATNGGTEEKRGVGSGEYTVRMAGNGTSPNQSKFMQLLSPLSSVSPLSTSPLLLFSLIFLIVFPKRQLRVEVENDQ